MQPNVTLTYEGDNHTEHNLGMVNHIGEDTGTDEVKPVTAATVPAGYVLVPVELLSDLRDFANPEIEKYCEMWDCRMDEEFPAMRKIISDADALLSAAPQSPGSQLTTAPGWTGNGNANAALVILDRIDTLDPADDDRIEEVKQIVRSLAEPKAPDGWIPVSERMPLDISHEEFRSMTAIVTDGLYVGMCDCQSGNGWVEWSNYGDINPEKITHWQPLPDAPKVTP